MQTSKD